MKKRIRGYVSVAVLSTLPLTVIAVQAEAAVSASSYAVVGLKQTTSVYEDSLEQGKALKAERNYKEALKYFKKAMQSDSTKAEAYYLVGQVNGELAASAGMFSAPGYAKASLAAYEAAVELDPTHLNARMSLIEYLCQAPGFMKGDKERALAEAIKLTDIQPAWGQTAQALVYEAMDDSDKALAMYAAVLEHTPNFPRALYERGLLHRELKNYAAAFRDFRNLMLVDHEEEADTDYVKLMRGRGQYFLGSVASISGDKIQEGINALENYLKARSFETPSREGFAKYYLATLYLDLGSVDVAKRLVSEASLVKSKSLQKRLKKLNRRLRNG